MTPLGRLKKDLPPENCPVRRPEPECWPVGEDPVTFTLTANAGTLIAYKNQRILVDGLHGGAEAFSGVPGELLETIIAGRAPFEGIGWLLYTHLHGDHFSAEATARFLRRNPEARLILPGRRTKGTEALASIEGRETRLYEPDPPPGEFFGMPLGEDVRLQAFSSRHAGEEYGDVAHQCLLLTCGRRNILFLGDADYDADFFAGMLRGITVHAAVANPLFISGARGRKALLEGVRPERLIVNHIPFQGEDPMRFREMVSRCLERYRSTLPPAAVLWDAVDVIAI